MGVFTFVCRVSGGEWSAKELNGELEGSASSTYDLQRSLVGSVLATDSSGGVQSSFSAITPSSAVFQVLEVIVGGAIGGAMVGGGAAAAGGAAGGAPPAEAAPAEEKEEKEGSDDEDMGFSLFD